MPSDWLSLSEVAGILGVHSGTVRNWSDKGFLPVHRTQGGHRRYLRSEIDLWMQAQNASNVEEDVHLVVKNALRNTRMQISEGRLNAESWYAKLDDKARAQYRKSSRSLMQGLIGYLAVEKQAGGAEAQALGYEYASFGYRYGLSVTEAVSAFLFFRNLLMESMMTDYVAASVRSPIAWSDMFRKMTNFTDQIMLTLLETYEAYHRNNR
jgi:excisionase family DNA binding protein